MFNVTVTVKAPNYDSIRKGVLAISRESKMVAILPIGSIYYFVIPGTKKEQKFRGRTGDPVIIAELTGYSWNETMEVGGRVHAFYIATAMSPRTFQAIPNRHGFALMEWRVTESSLG